MGTCATGNQLHCGGGVNVIAAALGTVRLVRALIDREGASDEADAMARPHP